MNFIIICMLHIIAGAICIYYIDTKWKIYESDWLFGIKPLQQYNFLVRIYPCDEGLLSLKFSALRHSAIPMICSALIWFVGAKWLCSISTFLALVYIWMPIMRNRVRKADYNEAGSHTQSMLDPVMQACSSVTVCAVANYIIVMIAYAFRP